MKRDMLSVVAGFVVAVAGVSAASAAPSKTKSSGAPSQGSARVASEPSGSFSGYPDWAQKAFAPKAGGGGGR